MTSEQCDVVTCNADVSALRAGKRVHLSHYSFQLLLNVPKCLIPLVPQRTSLCKRAIAIET